METSDPHTVGLSAWGVGAMRKKRVLHLQWASRWDPEESESHVYKEHPGRARGRSGPGHCVHEVRPSRAPRPQLPIAHAGEQKDASSARALVLVHADTRACGIPPLRG